MLRPELPVALLEPVEAERGVDLDPEAVLEQQLERVEQIGLVAVDERPHRMPHQ